MWCVFELVGCGVIEIQLGLYEKKLRKIKQVCCRELFHSTVESLTYERHSCLPFWDVTSPDIFPPRFRLHMLLSMVVGKYLGNARWIFCPETEEWLVMERLLMKRRISSKNRSSLQPQQRLQQPQPCSY